LTEQRLVKRSITAIFLAAQILLVMVLAARGNEYYIRGIVATTVLWLCYDYLEFKFHLLMSNYIRTIVVVTLLSDGFFGYYLEFYLTSTVFDKLQHGFGTYSFALFAYILAAQLSEHSLSRRFTFFLVVCLGISMGAVYEVLEFIVDSTTHPIPPGQPSLLDTDLDLVADIFGAILAAFHAISVKFINHNF
jgi:uncharacterized membrane protein YjdF